MRWSLRLVEDRLAPGASWTPALPAAHRVLYLAAGDLVIAASPTPVRIATNQACRAASEARAQAGTAGAHVLRFDLSATPLSPAGGAVALDATMDLDPAGGWLMRCDRVDFEPGGVALPHGHRGGGIRRLLRGRLDVTVGDGAPRAMRPGDAWFESGREPVLAVAAPDEESSFVRVSILPAEIRGRSSIVYVNPDDAARSRPRTYTVFVDDPIALV